MNKKYYVFASIIFGLYIPLLIYQFLLGKQHLFLFVFNYFFYVTAMVGAYGLSKEYNPNESMIHAIFKRYKFFYLLSFIPLVILS
ncbi:MAG: hypothetical protein KAI55_04385, partial [Candidatus Aenigmarchaeota archaeon]|nr:hypothetical protein [Candidatus Aenigmarchaeota archaeon]